MHGSQLIEEMRINKLQARLEQFGTDNQGHCPSGEEHDQAEDQIKGADVFMVGRK